MKKWFPEPNDAATLQSFRSVTIQRHQSSSVFCGIYDGLLGRVIFNLCGHRFIMGMLFDSWHSIAFVILFSSPPPSDSNSKIPKLTTFSVYDSNWQLRSSFSIPSIQHSAKTRRILRKWAHGCDKFL